LKGICPSTVIAAGARVPAAFVPSPMGRAVRACHAVVLAGWLAWQALVSGAGGRVELESQVELESSLPEFYGPSNPVPGAYKY